MTGLSPILGPGLVRRVLSEAGTDPGSATRFDYLDALDRLEGRLTIYLPRDEAQRRRRDIETSLAASAERE